MANDAAMTQMQDSIAEHAKVLEDKDALIQHLEDDIFRSAVKGCSSSLPSARCSESMSTLTCSLHERIPQHYIKTTGPHGSLKGVVTGHILIVSF